MMRIIWEPVTPGDIVPGDVIRASKRDGTIMQGKVGSLESRLGGRGITLGNGGVSLAFVGWTLERQRPAPVRVEEPQDRVQAFVDRCGEHEDFIETAWLPDGHGLDLTVSDVRDVLAELTEHQRLLVEIDEVLDQARDKRASNWAIIRELKKLMGNDPKGN